MWWIAPVLLAILVVISYRREGIVWMLIGEIKDTDRPG